VTARLYTVNKKATVKAWMTVAFRKTSSATKSVQLGLRPAA